MNPGNRELFAHLALALSRYTREIRREGIAPPPEVLALAEFFADCATVRPGATAEAGTTQPREAEAMNPLLTKRETAAALRCSVRTVERLIAAGDLVSVSVAGGCRVRRADLEDYVGSLGARRPFRETIEEKGA